MKYIQKQPEPTPLLEWKAMANDDWQPSYDNMPGDVKTGLKEALTHEQGGLCCYCEQRLTPDDSHIEHFRPQSREDVDPLDYENLMCSCQNRLKKGEPRHYGNKKENWFSETLLISPLNPHCEQYFSFTADGQIRATNSKAAEETISRLGLNISKLKDMRKKIIEPFLDDNITNEEFTSLVEDYLQWDDRGYKAFWTTIGHLFGGNERTAS